MSSERCRCDSDEVLAYVCGELQGEAETAVAEHLGECPECCEEAAEFTALGGVLGECCNEEVVRWHSFETPFGQMYVAGTERGLAKVSWQQAGPDSFADWLEAHFPGRPVVQDPDGLKEVERELREYFSGSRSRFDVRVDLSAVSEFDRHVLEAARRISFGQVVPYAELARRIGKPKAARAVGNALGRNPVAIVVPCHRVVRSDGTLGGYGGGVHWKEQLLALEGRQDLLAAS
ncbi:MAG: methylated-DNA--[protein]-cysteine S-methyltransferase [Gemmatimonadota bacterium]